MSMKNMTLLSGATVSATGGTALAFVDEGTSITNGVRVVVPADTAYATRRSVVAKYRAPTLDAEGLYTKDKKTLSLTKPLVLSSGKVIYNVIRIEREVHPDLSAADALELNKLAAQMCIDTDLDNFWTAGSLA